MNPVGLHATCGRVSTFRQAACLCPHSPLLPPQPDWRKSKAFRHPDQCFTKRGCYGGYKAGLYAHPPHLVG